MNGPLRPDTLSYDYKFASRFAKNARVVANTCSENPVYTSLFFNGFTKFFDKLVISESTLLHRRKTLFFHFFFLIWC